MKLTMWLVTNRLSNKCLTVFLLFLSAMNLALPVALASEKQKAVSSELQNDSGELVSPVCNTPYSFNEPIVIVFRDVSQNPEWLQGEFSPKLYRGTLDELDGTEKTIILVPEGKELSDEDLTALKGLRLGRFGRRIFWFWAIPNIAQEVFEALLEENTTSPFDAPPSSVDETEIRTLTREICLDVTLGLGEAWGICDFFGDVADQVIIRLRNFLHD